MNDPLSILESARGMTILLYIRENDGCLKSDIYREASHNQSLSSKLDSLESAGLISRRICGRGTRFSLTDAGRRVSDLLLDVRAVIAGDERGPPDRKTPAPLSPSSHLFFLLLRTTAIAATISRTGARSSRSRTETEAPRRSSTLVPPV